MVIKVVFIRELSKRIKILEATRKELAQEISILSSEISESSYQSWVLNNFIIGMSGHFNTAIEMGNGSPDFAMKLKKILFKEVLKLNPALTPTSLYVSEINTLTLNKEKIKLIDCLSWKVEEDVSDLVVFDMNNYFKVVESAKDFDHFIENEEWDLYRIFVNIRKYNKNLKIPLIQGQHPKTENDVQYFVVVTCVDNFQQLYSHIVSSEYANVVPFNTIVESLYELCVKHNPFLDLKVKDFKKINKGYKHFKQGMDGNFAPENIRMRKNLASVPKKEVLGLKETLNKQLFGQEDAITGVSNAVSRAYSGIKDSKAPIGAFFFYGPTSTGKTELAKILAKTLTKSTSGLLKIACNTLTASHSVSTLLGSPPGYVGYEERGLIEKGLETSSFKVILFDEIEKAHPRLMDVLLEVLEEGELLLANGNVVNLSECIIIFTSNIGQSESNKAANTAGFTLSTHSEADREEIINAEFERTVKDKLKPEFMARLNGIYLFRNLKEEDLLRAANAKLQKYTKLLFKRKIKLTYSKTITTHILTKCKEKNKNPHARDIKNFIDLEIMQKLGDFVIGLNLNEKQDNYIDIQLSNNELQFKLLPLKGEDKATVH